MKFVNPSLFTLSVVLLLFLLNNSILITASTIPTPLVTTNAANAPTINTSNWTCRESAYPDNNADLDYCVLIKENCKDLYALFDYLYFIRCS
eukprot:Pgem_evm1s10676